MILNEMAFTQAEAINKCLALGKQFIKHFHKIYAREASDDITHWETEMATWLDDVCHIKLKSTKRYVLIGDLRDWFFTAGADYEEWAGTTTFEEPFDYDEFETYLSATIQKKRKSDEFMITRDDINDALVLAGVLK